MLKKKRKFRKILNAENFGNEREKKKICAILEMKEKKDMCQMSVQTIGDISHDSVSNSHALSCLMDD